MLRRHSDQHWRAIGHVWTSLLVAKAGIGVPWAHHHLRTTALPREQVVAPLQNDEGPSTKDRAVGGVK